MKNKILIVDDEAANLRLLERLFRDTHEVQTASSGDEGLAVLGRFDAALIISDQRMPGMTGIQFLKKAAVLRPQTVRIILTGYTDVDDLVEAINSSVIYRYITKPWVNSELMQSVIRGIEFHETLRTQYLLGEANNRLQSRLEVTVLGFINSIRDTITQKSSGLSEHCRRTAKYAVLMGEQLGVEASELEQLVTAALLHEAPGLRIPFALNLRRSALSPDQLHTTQSNYTKGVTLISQVPDLARAAEILIYQHEHFDGNGLFLGLLGNKLPMLSRILAVANAFDEMTHTKAHALNRLGGDAATRIRSLAGTVLDPEFVEVCLKSVAGQSADEREIVHHLTLPVSATQFLTA